MTITISRLEERQNAGRHRILNLLQAKTMQAEVSAKELLNNCLVGGRITASAASGQFYARQGRLDSNAQGPLPLAALIDITATRSRTDIGGINPNTYTWWGNQVVSASGISSWAGLKNKLNNCYNSCSKGTGGSPDLMLSDQSAWEQYWGSLESKERYIIEDKRKVDALGGTDALAFRGAAWVWDEVCPDTVTNAEIVDALGTHTLSTCFLINSDALEFVTDSATNWTTGPFVKPENQEARTAVIQWMGAFVTNNRRKLGQVHSITKTAITS